MVTFQDDEPRDGVAEIDLAFSIKVMRLCF